MHKVTMANYLLDPKRYELRSGKDQNSPLCPFGNRYEWIGYDKNEEEYVRFAKSVFKLLVKEIN